MSHEYDDFYMSDPAMDLCYIMNIPVEDLPKENRNITRAELKLLLEAIGKKFIEAKRWNDYTIFVERMGERGFYF